MPYLNQTPHIKTSLLIQGWCWVRIILHVVYGIFLLSVRFPFVKRHTKDQYIQSWSLTLLSIFGITLRVRNQEILPSTPYMLAANHISWMDIHAINAFRPIRFVAKSEVATWPIFGWMARQLGTVFIRRDSSRHGKHIAGELGALLHHESVCIFPEGTSTSGGNVLPFKPNLFEAAVLTNAPVFSLAISYRSSLTNQRTEVPAFIGDMGLIESMRNILRDRHLLVDLVFLLPAGSGAESSKDRKWLALHSQEAITAQLSSNNPSM